MPLGVKPECVKCHIEEAAMWKKTDAGYMCNECDQKQKEEDKKLASVVEPEPPKPPQQETSNTTKITLRKSTRMTRNYKTRSNPYALPKVGVRKGKGRRTLFKKKPVKTTTATATPLTSSFLFYKGQYFQIGDIVSLLDVDGGTYYAQIRGLMTDTYCEKSAVISWLLPTTGSPPPDKGFDPSTYIIGPDEEISRKLDCLEFVMHAPSDYFRSSTTPYPAVPTASDKYTPGFLWTRLSS